MKQPSLHKGFTLIELLVVVAIIALLAATILASLGGARTKARDARATSELSSMRAQAELYYNNHNFSYGTAGDCSTASLFTDTTPDSLNTLYGDISTYSTDVACLVDAGGVAWAAAAKLSSGIFCVDSNGVARTAASSISSAINAISTSAQCQ